MNLALRQDTEYQAAEKLEDALRAVAAVTPAWLYDATKIGSLIDDLNRARFDYEQANRVEDARIEAKIAERRNA